MRAALLATVLSLAISGTAGAATPTRYSLANGCYSLTNAATGQAIPGAAQLRMQATTLGSYLLYRTDRTVLAVNPSGDVGPVLRASPAADWRVTEAGGGGFNLSPASKPTAALGVDGGGLTIAGAAGRFSFTPATGCAIYPEAELNATGTPKKGATSYGTVSGLLEGHMHWMTYEYIGGKFHCGRPWHPYGIQYALPDCSEIEGPGGLVAPMQNFLNFGLPASPHDTTGYPKLTEWSNHNLTYEGTYWKWIQRAWLGGMRMMVMSVNENRILCLLQTNRTSNCDEMDTVRRGFKDIRELQRYVDAQAGGPGKGFFEIVTTPNEARRVINKGKMAVVLEIEISELFGCSGWEHPNCDRAKIDRGLDEMYKLGVRSSLLLNKVDNPLTGVRFDSGPIGVLINGANRLSAGTFFSAETCKGPEHDNEIFNPPAGDTIDELLGVLGLTRGSLPVYPPGPHCNTRGLTDLGRYTERQMMKKHMIINPDHMSQKAVDDTLTLLEANKYSGVISPHGWMDPGNWPRLWKLGGLAFPSASGSAENYVKEYEKFRPRKAPYLTGWGYGADLGGLAAQPTPPAAKEKIQYPFKSADGKVTLGRQRTGDRTFDYDTEGVAHYGLYADFYESVRKGGGPNLARDMSQGAEAYLQMWERADGVKAPGCRAARGRVTGAGISALRLGRTWETLLTKAGQPQQRTRAWSWCVKGKGNSRAADVAELSSKGKVELVASTARGRSARGVKVGSSSKKLRRTTRSAGGSLRVRRAGKVTYVYSVRKGKVRAVGVATRSLGRKKATLRAAMRRVLGAKASSAPRTFVPASPSASKMAGYSLSGSTNPQVNRALSMLCSLGS